VRRRWQSLCGVDKVVHGRHGAARRRAQQAVRMARGRNELEPVSACQTPARFSHQQVAQAIERRHVFLCATSYKNFEFFFDSKKTSNDFCLKHQNEGFIRVDF
jgi:hypothetical protein